MAQSPRPTRRPLQGVLLFLVSLLVLTSILSSPPWAHQGPLFGLPADACGEVGRVLSELLLGGLGAPLLAWLLMVSLAIGSRFLFLHPTKPWGFLRWSFLPAAAVSILGAALWGGTIFGRLAELAAGALRAPKALGPVGSALLAIAIFVGALVLALPRLLSKGANDALLSAGGAPFRFGGAAFGRAALAYKTAKVERQARAIEEAAQKKAAREAARRLADDARANPSTAEPAIVPPPLVNPLRDVDILASLSTEKRRANGDTRAKKETKPRPPTRSASGYVLPPIALLEEDHSPPLAIDREEVLDNGRTLVRALKDFGIEGQLGQAHPGPVITQYEYEPAAGVKISQIVSRAEDLALALKASRVRLVAPIPGKAAVGIEVPNRTAAMINFRTILSELDLHASAGELPLVLGRDIRGRAHLAKLDAMPHLLVAGTTGSGKSVCLNVLLLSLLYRRTPDELRLLLIDPKMLELTPYDGIPHLLCPVVTEAKMAAKMLGWLVTEMERRYRRMASFGVRNLTGYHVKVAAAKPEDDIEPMPYIVVIVDELADLMMTVANEVEGPIARLAQMARAVGIHLILATQRPSVDVLTGVIKANFPARIAFQVASKVDSRTILDANGAESLLGRGDMLFLPPGKAEATRVHGAFVSDRDTEAVVNFLKQQPPAPEIFREELLARESEEAGFDDELFEDALRLVVTQRMASTSFLQRRLKVGYSRAGRLMDLLQQVGAVGAQDGSKAREVLADDRFLDDWLKKERLRATGVEH